MRETRFPLIVGCVLSLLIACTTIETKRFEPKGGGVPYTVPISVMTIELDVSREKDGEFKSVQLSLAPVLVPDPSKNFYLHSKHFATFESDHHIKVRNGLLTSIEATDKGQAGEVALNVLNSAINLYKASQLIPQAQTELANPLHTKSKVPTPAEIQYALGLIQGDKLTFDFDGNTAAAEIPGTNGLLNIASSYTKLVDAPSALALVPQSSDTFEGVFTRLLKPAMATLDLKISGSELRERRIAALEKAIQIEERSKRSLERVREVQMNDRVRACPDGGTTVPLRIKREEIAVRLDTVSKLRLHQDTPARATAIASRIEDLRTADTIVNEQIDACESAIKNIESTDTSILNAQELISALTDLKTGNESMCPAENVAMCDANGYQIQADSDIVMIADDQIFRVPVRASIMGETKNTLTFTDGILTEFHGVRPSPAVEATRALLSLTDRLVSMPTDLISLKVDLTEKQSELAKAQATLESDLVALTEEVRRQAEIERQMTLLKTETDLKIEQARIAGQLDSISDVSRKARLDSEKQVLESEKSVLSERSLVAVEEDKLTGTTSEIAALSGQINLLAKQRELAETSATLPITSSEIEALDNQKAVLKAELAVLQKQKEVRALQKEIRDIEKDIEQLDEAAAE